MARSTEGPPHRAAGRSCCRDSRKNYTTARTTLPDLERATGVNKSGLFGVTPHVLRSSFASIADDLGFTEVTIAALVGHASAGLLFAAAIPLGRDGLTGAITWAIAVVCFVLLLTTKIDTLWMILGAALVSLTASSIGLIAWL
jgi:chromate transport protein ChrA